MMKFFHRWMICRSAEQGVAPPRFTQRAMARDVALRRFAQVVQSLPDRLRADAAKLTDVPAPTVDLHITSHRTFRPVWALGALAAAAAVVLAVVLSIAIAPPPAPQTTATVALDLPTPDAVVSQLALAVDDSFRTQWRLVAADGSTLARNMLSPLSLPD